jgi:hypothetical protein
MQSSTPASLRPPETEKTLEGKKLCLYSVVDGPRNRPERVTTSCSICTWAALRHRPRFHLDSVSSITRSPLAPLLFLGAFGLHNHPVILTTKVLESDSQRDMGCATGGVKACLWAPDACHVSEFGFAWVDGCNRGEPFPRNSNTPVDVCSAECCYPIRGSYP